ncbi:MAG: hypothetical protein HQ565_01870 [Bacteroidetes bacterium]|nr:hypothetical protein [Bacteroidota bacterium]
MKRLFYIGLLLTLLFGCNQDKEAELKENIVLTIETFVTSKLDKGMTLDSVIITKIDTITPMQAMKLEYRKVLSEMEKQVELYKIQAALIENKSDQIILYNSINPNGKSTLDIMYRDLMNEKEKADNLAILIEELETRGEQLMTDLESNSIDSTTFLNYLVIAKITVTNPDMTQETRKFSMQITKDFKIKITE